MFNIKTILRAPHDEDENEGTGDSPFEGEEEELEEELEETEKEESEDEEESEENEDEESEEEEESENEEEESEPQDQSALIETIAKSVAAGMKSATPEARQPELTQEQTDKLLNRYLANEDALRAMGIAEPTSENVQAFQTIIDNVAKHSNTVAKVMLQAEMAKLQPQLAAVQSTLGEVETEKIRNKFFDSYKELKPYEKIVKAVSQTIDEKKAASMTLEEGMKFVAKETRRILKDSGITLKKQSTNGANANHSAERRVPAMAGLSGSGRSSTGGNKKDKNNPDADIYKGWG